MQVLSAGAHSTPCNALRPTLKHNNQISTPRYSRLLREHVSLQAVEAGLRLLWIHRPLGIHVFLVWHVVPADLAAAVEVPVAKR